MKIHCNPYACCLLSLPFASFGASSHDHLMPLFACQQRRLQPERREARALIVKLPALRLRPASLKSVWE
jgi:hypothetical protein